MMRKLNQKILAVLLVVFVLTLVLPMNAEASEAFLKTKQVSQLSVAGSFQASVSQNGDGVPNDWSLGQYATASNKGAIGMLAHNYLMGMYFPTMYIGQEITVKYSDGTSQMFVVSNVLRYKATDPDNFSKPFLSKNGSGSQMSAMQVFNQAYKNGWLTLQTCIAAEGHSSWGLLFIQASPKK